jgi:hypothetical protein
VRDLKQITLRGIPNELERRIKKEAQRKGLSLNKAFISLLEKEAGLKGKNKKKETFYHELDHLSGIWTGEEAETFKRSLEFQRKIEDDLWKNAE